MKPGKKVIESIGGSDWERVKREASQDLPVTFDPETDPYAPNDAEAVREFWRAATVKRGPGQPALTSEATDLELTCRR
jgi:hypothetical protein